MLQIECGNATPTLVTNEIEFLSSPRRMKRALQFLGGFWAAALLSIPLPGLHFVLVPGFFLAGLGYFFVKLRETRRLSLQGTNCPSCGKPLKDAVLHFGSDFPRLYCYECRQHLWLSEAPPRP